MGHPLLRLRVHDIKSLLSILVELGIADTARQVFGCHGTTLTPKRSAIEKILFEFLILKTVISGVKPVNEEVRSQGLHFVACYQILNSILIIDQILHRIAVSYLKNFQGIIQTTVCEVELSFVELTFCDYIIYTVVLLSFSHGLENSVHFRLNFLVLVNLFIGLLETFQDLVRVRVLCFNRLFIVKIAS